MYINNVTLSGRAGRDPEFKEFNSGKTLAELSMAVQRPFKNTDGNYDTDWFQVKIWGKAAEVARDFLKKGQIFAVTGKLEVEKWTDNNGNNREKVVIVAERLCLGQKPQGEQQERQPAGQSPGGGDYGFDDEDEIPF